ncbi:MAG: hypothetical protein KJ607_00520, partial [Bacteroidetes bacterium]|nr:hypothetical protein [Bacteroidota bacterium]
MKQLIICIFVLISILLYNNQGFSMGAPCVPDLTINSLTSANNNLSTCDALLSNNMLSTDIACEGTDDMGYGYAVAYWMSSAYDYIIQYTPNSTGYIDLTVNADEDWAGVIVSQGGCPDAGTCLTHDVVALSGNPTIDYLYVTAGTTYYIVVSMW